MFGYFPFGFGGRVWGLIVSVPDCCLSFYFEGVNFDLYFANRCPELRIYYLKKDSGGLRDVYLINP